MSNSRGFTAISMAISMVIILAMMAIFFGYGGRYLGGSGGRGGAPQQAMGKAKDVVCRNNLRQIRAALQIPLSGDADERYPDSLDQLGLSSEQLVCPVGGEAYNYAPESGDVSCNYPRHKGY